MPWSINNVPAAIKKKTKEEKRVFAEVANAALKAGKSEQDAVFAGLAAIKNYNNKRKTMNKSEVDSNFVPIAKSSNPVYKQALFVVLEPDTVDAHGDIYDAETVMKACHNFNKSKTVKPNLYHITDTDGFDVVESFIAPISMVLSGEVVKAGTWLVNLQFGDNLWAKAQAGEFSGVSIGAIAEYEEME